MYKDIFIAIVGVEGLTKPFEIAEGVTLRPIAKPPSIFDIARVADLEKSPYLAMAEMAQYVRAEIEIKSNEVVTRGYNPLNLGWLFTALMKLKGYGFLYCPILSDYSFEKIPEIQKRIVTITPLDYHFSIRVHPDDNKRIFILEDVEWAFSHYLSTNDLAAKNENFNLALQSSISYTFTKSWRLALAEIWLGLEALFSPGTSELRYRISNYLATYLYKSGEDRLKTARIVKKLYDVRSKAVHGASVEEEKLRNATFESYDFLRTSLLKIIESKAVPTSNELEHLMLAPSDIA